MKRFGQAALGAAVLSLGLSAVAFADGAPEAVPTTTFEVGARIWYSNGTAEYPLMDGSTKVSALHYEDQTAVSPELFARVNSTHGVFFKALGSFGGVTSGTLIDEDFPPAVVPYSKTTSSLDGDLDFFAFDVGYAVLNDEMARLGVFAGYGYWHEHFTASGCRQIGSNPGICGVFPIPGNIAVIDEDDKYRSIRLGVTGDGHLTDRLVWQAEGVYLITDHDNLDTHHFTFGDAHANGDGNGYQLEAALLYQFTPKFNLGLGARWWHLDTDLDVAAFGGETESYSVDRAGVFVQGGLKLN